MKIQKNRKVSKAPAMALPIPIPAASPVDIVLALFADL